MGTSFRKTAISNGISLMYSLSWMGTSKSRPHWSNASSLGVSWSQMAAAVSGRVSQRPIYAIWYIMHLLSLSYNGGFLDGQIVVIHGDQLFGGLWGTHEPGALAPGVHPCDGEEVGFGGSGISGVKIVVGVEVHQIHLLLRQPLGPAHTGLSVFQ